MTGISIATSSDVLGGSEKSKDNIVSPTFKVPLIFQDSLVLPDVPVSPLLPLVPTRVVDVEEKKLVSVSLPT